MYSKVTPAEYSRPGYQVRNEKFHPHSDNEVRGHERDGLRHVITRHGEPSNGYHAEMSEGNKMPPRDNKIRGLPPHDMYRNGVSEDAKGMGAARNDAPNGNQNMRHGGMPKHGMVNTKGTR